LTINLYNSSPVASWRCRLILPEGITYKKVSAITTRCPEDEDDPVVSALYRETENTVFIASNFSTTGLSLSGNDGAVATVTVSIPSDFVPGEYNVKIEQVSLASPEGTSLSCEQTSTFKWTIQTNTNPIDDPGTDSIPANIFYMTAPNGKIGQTAQLTLNIKNSEPIQGWACHLFLPDGVDFSGVSVNSSSRYEFDPYVDVRDTSVGGVPNGGKQIAIVCYTKDEQIKFKPLFGDDGPVATVKVSVSNSVTPGEHVIGIKNISLSSPDGVSLSVNETADFSWMILGPTYTITFDSNGGSPVESITQGYGSTITPPANPTREGYTFLGWEPELPTVMPKNNMTVTAKWAINSYTLTYVVDGEVYKTSSVVYGSAITPEAEPTKTGYTFSGWSEIPATMPAGDVTVTGSFAVNSYTLTYMVDGEVYKTSSVNYGAAITPEAEPTKPSYTFSGWSEIPATMPAHDVTVTGTFTYIGDTEISGLDNVVYIDNVEGFVGQQLTLSVKMKNTVGIQTVQFDLCLPEGVTVAKDEDGFDLIELSTERTTARKMDSFSSSQVSGGAYRVLINSNRGYTFDGEDGEIALVTVNIDPEMQEGDYPIYLRDIVLVNTNSEGYETEYVKSTITVSAYTPGDVNGDGKLNAIDLNAIVNYILEHRNFPFTFVEKAADLNADDKINAIDVNALTNLILRGETPQSAKKQMPIMVGTLEER